MSDSTSPEEWRPVVGYEGWYSVSSIGRVRRDMPGRGCRAGEILSTAPTTTGYPRVGLVRHGVQTTLLVHAIVAAAFIGPKPRGLSVNHIDGVKTNNRVANLEYVTLRENALHAVRIGLAGKKQSECRKGHPYLPDNLFVLSDGERGCKICRKASRQRYEAKMRLSPGTRGSAPAGS